MVVLGRLLAAAATCAVAAALVPAATAAPAPQAASPQVAALPTAVRLPAVRTIAVGSNPIDVVISQKRGNAYVANDGSVSVVNLTTHRETAEFGTGNFHGQNAIALARYETQGYIVNLQKPVVTIFDTRSYKVIGHIKLPAAGQDVTTTRAPIGERAYVALLNNKILAISTLRAKVVATITLPQQAQTIVPRPGGRQLWAGGITSGVVYVISTSTNRVVRSIATTQGGPVSSMAFSPDGRTLWVAGLGGITVIAASTGKIKAFIPINRIFGGFPNMGDIVVSGSGRFAVVENSTFPDAPGQGMFAAISAASYGVAWRVRGSIEPVALAIDTKRRTIYAPNYAVDTMSYFAGPL